MSKDIKAEDLRKNKYYKIAHEGSLELNHPAMQILKQEVGQSDKILDMGCGEGTRLAKLLGDKNLKEAIGVDNNELAIKLASNNYPKIRFLVGSLDKLPFRENYFNLSFSAYVFEHLETPEKVLKEAFRVTKEGGEIFIVAPNFGSPNRRSPNSVENRFFKLIKGLLLDFKFLFKKRSSLDWTKVTPRNNRYIIDADTTTEPYLNSLIKYCNLLGLKVLFASSYWNMDKWTPFQFLFRILGAFKIYPFYLWGPHLCLLLKK